MSIIEEYWSGVARRLQEEVNTFNKLIRHSGEQGRENELSLSRLMENLLPSSVGIGSGMIIDSIGSYSKQTDIIIYDAGSQPAIMAQSNQVIFPIESVLLAIEVKTTLTEEELGDCVKKRNSFKALMSKSDRPIPPYVVLAYHAGGMPPTVAKHIRDIPESERPELLCVVEPGILAASAKVIDASNEDGYLIGIAGLHSTAPDGSRLPSTWQKPDSAERTESVLRNGSPYPVARLGMRRDTAIIGEPGRALLIFCAAILDLLAKSSNLPDSVLKHYLQFPAREMAELPEQS
jgi:hypothetical protein